MKTPPFSAIFELDPKHTVEFLTNFYFLKTFLNANQPEELAEMFDSEQDKIGFLEFGLPYVKYLKNLANVVLSAKHFTTSQPDKVKRKRKKYQPVLIGKELSAPEIEHLEKKLFGRRLLYPIKGSTINKDTYAPWYVHDTLYGNVLHFLENTPSINGSLSSEDLEFLVNHIITCANEFRLVEEEMDLLEYAFRGFNGDLNLELPFPLSWHLDPVFRLQRGNHPSIRRPDMYKEWEYGVMDFIYGRTADHFGGKNLSEYQQRIIAGYIAVLIGIFKTAEEFEKKNTSGSWHEYLAKNVKNHVLKVQKMKKNRSLEDRGTGQ